MVNKYHFLQEALIEFFLVITVFNVISSLIALSVNSIMDSLMLLVSEIISLIIFCAYIGYFVAFVLKNLDY